MKELLGTARPELARLLPDLGHVSEPLAGDGLGINSGQARLFEAVLDLLRRLARGPGLLFVVEDAHWADPSTLDLLAYLARNSHDAGIVMLATFRTDELHRRHPLLPYLAELERGRAMQRIDLTRFDREELASQIRRSGASLRPRSARGCLQSLWREPILRRGAACRRRHRDGRFRRCCATSCSRVWRL